jgi:hypothetical protein
VANRYCRNCGHELAEDDRFCPNCGTPIQEAAHVPTPEADVPVPPPPGQQQAGEAAPPPQQAQAAPRRRSTASKILIGCAGLFVVLVLFVGCLAVLAGGGGDQQPAGSGSEEQDREKEFMAGRGPVPKDIRKCAVGQPCKMGASTLTVTNVRMDDIVPITFDKPLTNGPYVFVDYTYTYGGNEVVSISEHPQWPLQVGDNRYLPDYDATSSWSIDKDEDISLEDMQPGVPIKGHLVYKVAPGSKDFTLGVEDLIAPNKSSPAAIPLPEL